MSETLPQPISTLTRSQRTQIVNLVRRAGRSEVMSRFRRLTRDEIDTKSTAQDLVTEADRAAEAMIARGLVRMFPNALIVGEEDVSGGNRRVLDKIAGAEMAFVIDPVDGTWNFANGLTVFGMILSMTRFGQPVFGLLYDPVMDDLVIADEGAEALFVRPQRPAQLARTSKGGQVDSLTGYMGLHHVPDAKRAALAATMPRFDRATSLRCTCHEFRMLVQGRVDFVFSSGLTPWDHAAGAYLTKAAGGHAALLDGSPYRADAPRDAYLLCASDAATWGRLQDVFGFLLES